jgi:hypothetical protein
VEEAVLLGLDRENHRVVLQPSIQKPTPGYAFAAIKSHIMDNKLGKKLVSTEDEKLLICADKFLSLLVPVSIMTHLFLAPYTKVEESFNIQATHDILLYGVPIKNTTSIAANFDHVDFPGAVPRTFVGALALAACAVPLIRFAKTAFESQLLGMYFQK